MKAVLFALFLLLQAPAPPAHAAFYQWTDGKGVVHLTDDLDTIPKRYRDRAKTLKSLPKGPAPAGPAATAPRPPSPPQETKPQPSPGGHPELWWRQRFASLRGEIKTLEDALPQKEAKLVELRRQRAIFTRARDREAVNAMAAEISSDEARLFELRKEVEALEQEASRAGVPPEWRR